MSPSRPVLWEGAKRPPRKWQAAALPIILDALLKRRVRGVVSVCTGGGKSVALAELCRAALPGTKAAGRVIIVSTPTQSLVRQLSATVAERCGVWDVGMFYADRKESEKTIIVTCNASLPTLTAELALDERQVSLLIADECHSSESDTMRAVIPELKPLTQVGFTATPFRSAATQALSGWDEVIFRYTFADALADGVLVPFSDHIVKWDGSGEGDLDAVCLDMIRRHGVGPGIVSAVSIADATAYAAKLTEAGVPAAPIHSKLGAREQVELLEQLRRGDLRCLVHVALLAEGVDLPWLRWICLRRAVSARVRFIQELGRVLRVCEPDAWGPKTFATVMDPHDLLGKLGIAHEAAVGLALEEEASEDEAETKKRDKKQLIEEIRKLPEPTAVDAATLWTQRMLLELQAHGLAPTSTIQGSRWRDAEPSEKQAGYLQRLAKHARHLPEDHRVPVKLMVARAETLSRGAVSDLISILRAVADAAREDAIAHRPWRWPEALDVDVLDEVVVGRLEMAAKAAKKERAA